MRHVTLTVFGKRRLRYGGVKKYGWKLAINGEVVATDGRQDYNNAADAQETGEKVASGNYSDYQLRKVNV